MKKKERDQHVELASKKKRRKKGKEGQHVELASKKKEKREKRKKANMENWPRNMKFCLN